MATSTTTSSDRIAEQEGDVTYIRTDKDLPPVAIIDRSPITTRHKIIFGAIALVGAVAWAIIAFFRGETVNAVWFVIAAICTYVIGFPVLCAADRDEDRQAARRPRHPRRDLRERQGLHAHRPAGAVRPPLRRDRRRRPAGRAGAGDADGLPARHHLDHRRRGVRRMRPGLPGAVDLDAPTRAVTGPDGPRRTRASSAVSPRSIGVLVIMVILLAVLALVVVNALAESPWGVFSIAMTIPIACSWASTCVPAARQGVGGVADRRRAAAAGHRLRRLGRRNRLGRRLVHAVQGHVGLVHHRLRVGRLGAAGVAAARAARLPVDLHEGRHHRAAGDRHPARPAGHGGTGGLRRSPSTATARCSPARCSRSCSSRSPAARCPASTR